MKKVVLIYGLIAGVIVAILMFITMPLWDRGILTLDDGELVGYTTSVIALSMIFFGVKSYRDNYSDGAVSFWKAVKIGMLITLIASVMYALAWEVCYHTMTSDFTQRMTDHYFAELKSDGATEAEIQKAKEDWMAFQEYYKIPIIRFLVTLTEILPVGIVISLITGALLRKKEFLPSSPKTI